MNIESLPAAPLTSAVHQPRVLYLNPTADLYGASRGLLNLLSHPASRAWNAEVVLPAHGALETELQSIGVVTHVAPNLAVARKGLLGPRGLLALASTLLPSARTVARIAQAMGADAIHTNSTVVLSGALAAKLAHTPHIWHVREITATNSALWRAFGTLMLRASQRVVCVSQATADQFNAFPFHQRAQVIYDGLDLDRITYAPGRADARRSFGLADDALVIGMMGYLNPRKGADVLIEALAQINAGSGGTVKALIAGEPYQGYQPYVDQLRTRVHQLGLARDVQFVGFLRDVARFYAAIDVFALPTHEPEGFGLTLLEAAAAGLPSIASALGGAREVIEDGVTGVLIAPGSSTALAQAVMGLRQHPSQRVAMGVAARKRALERFSLDQTCAETERLYASVRRPPRDIG